MEYSCMRGARGARGGGGAMGKGGGVCIGFETLLVGGNLMQVCISL